VADHRSAFFRKFFVSGSVWTTVETFPDESSAWKFLVIIREISRAVYYLRPTSKSRYFRIARHCSFVEIPKGTCEVFSVDTFISCDQLHSKSRDEFEQLFAKGKIDYKGQISPETLGEIEAKMKASKVLSEREKRYLFGEDR
jgi:hypothetical protein